MDSDTMTRHPPKEWRQIAPQACTLKGTPPPRHSTCDTDRASGTFTRFRGPILQTLIHARNARSPSMNKTSKSFFFLAALSAIAAALILQSLDNAQASPGDRVSATYSGGTLRLTIPFRGLHPGTGQLTVDVLDPEDGVLGSAQQRVDVTQVAGSWREEIPLDKAPSLDDMVWHRIRYRFIYADQKDAAVQGTESISEILRPPVVHILGQQSYLTGGAAAVRVIVTDSKNDVIAGPGSVRILLMAPADRPRVLFNGPLNRRGTTEPQFRFPAGVACTYPRSEEHTS